MATTPTPTPISAANIPFHTRWRLPSPPSFLRSPSLAVKCSNPLNVNGSSNTKSSELIKNGKGLKNVLSGIVDEHVDELLDRDENRVLLDGLDTATQRVQLAKRELAEIAKQEIEVRKMKEYINQLETRGTEIAEVQKELSEARARVEEAGHALQVNEDGDGEMMMTEIERKVMYTNKEKLESIKAASISAIVGTLASLPVSLTHVTTASELIHPTAITIISCALYGATFRYAVRRDLDDFHLKTGTSAAFGIVKGLATLDEWPSLRQEAGSLLSHAFSGAVCVSENLLIFLFAAAGLDICFKLGILSPFPVERSVSRTKM